MWTATTPSVDYPELGQLFGAWSHEDWDIEVGEDGDWPEIIDAYIAGQGVDHAKGALREPARPGRTNGPATPRVRPSEAPRSALVRRLAVDMKKPWPSNAVTRASVSWLVG